MICIEPPDVFPKQLSDPLKLANLLIEFNRGKIVVDNLHWPTFGKPSSHPANWPGHVRNFRCWPKTIEDRSDNRHICQQTSCQSYRECKWSRVSCDQHDYTTRSYNTHHLCKGSLLCRWIHNVVNRVCAIHSVKCSIVKGHCAQICNLELMRNLDIRKGEPSYFKAPVCGFRRSRPGIPG
jgi:hypothetical protein